MLVLKFPLPHFGPAFSTPPVIWSSICHLILHFQVLHFHLVIFSPAFSVHSLFLVLKIQVLYFQSPC